MLTPLPPTDTRGSFRPLCHEFAGVLRGLSPGDWERPTVAGTWRVRDVVAHLIDVGLRRLSFHRDRHAPPSPAADGSLVGFINALNAEWVRASHRFSPAILLRLYEVTTEELASFVEGVRLADPALFPVSWAGEQRSDAWFDIGREFTEVWHHQMQVRDAVGAPEASDPRWLHLVLLVALRGLPYGLRETVAAAGSAVQLDVTGAAGGSWVLVRSNDRWELRAGRVESPTAALRLPDRVLGRVLFNAMPVEEALAATEVRGEPGLARSLLNTRTLVV